MSIAKQQSRSLIIMRRVQLIAMFILATSLCWTEATNHPLHCAKWQSHCHKYDLHCTSEGRVERKSCCELLTYGSSGESSREINRTRNLPSNIYSIKLGTYSTTQAWCDMITDGGGWMVILRRANGIESFDRFYDEYEEGFGNLEHDFFYGLKVIHDLTSKDTYEMRIDLFVQSNDTESSAHAVYKSFQIGPKEYNNSEGYKLYLDGFTSETLLDNLMVFNQQPFIAKKRNQPFNDLNQCLKFGQSKGGWWYLQELLQQDTDSCRGSEGTGAVLTGPSHRVSWFDPNTIHGKRFYEKVELKIRQKNCLPDTLSVL